MAYGINGTLLNFQDPGGTDSTSTNLNVIRNYVGRGSIINSVNLPLTHSVRWQGNLNEFEEPQASNFVSATDKGDIVNVIFDVYQVNDYSYSPSFPLDYTLVASVRKSRDIPNISQEDKIYGGDGVQTINYHTFTLDISEICKDLLSYALLPQGKGTMTDWRYGGLSGGNRQQSNLAEPVWSDDFAIKRNGCVRWIRVHYRTEIIDANGIIREATASGSYLSSQKPYSIINSAPDFGTSLTASQGRSAGWLIHSGWGASKTYPRQMCTNAPNKLYSTSSSLGIRIAKDIRMEESNEVFYWMQSDTSNRGIYYSNTNPEGGDYATNTSDLIADFHINIRAYSPTGAYLRSAKLYDFNENLRPKETLNGVTGVYPRTQNRYCTQNISPIFINANVIHNSSTVKASWENGGTTYTRYRIDTDNAAKNQNSLFLNDEVGYYMTQGVMTTTTQGNGTGAAKGSIFEYRWYKIDRESEIKTTTPLSSSVTNTVYAGIYYTELRDDQLTLAKPVRYKGFRNFSSNPKYPRIYWLNKLGGIDSYTFKGNHTVSYSASKDLILTKSPDRTDMSIGASQPTYPNYYGGNTQDPFGAYSNDGFRGSNVYEGGTSVLNVDGVKSGVLTSRPLHQGKAEWLRELLTSPNVWMEHWQVQSNVGSEYMIGQAANRNLSNLELGSGGWKQDGRAPLNFNYVPIIITSTDIETYDREKGQVTMTLNYMNSHSIVTQRN
jgi:hypothetical protein